MARCRAAPETPKFTADLAVCLPLAAPPVVGQGFRNLIGTSRKPNVKTSVVMEDLKPIIDSVCPKLCLPLR